MIAFLQRLWEMWRSVTKRLDLWLLLMVAMLYGLGLVFIHDIGTQTGGVIGGYALKQSVWVIGGFIIMAAMAFVDPEFYIRRWYVFYGIGIFFLLMVLLVGIRINGAKSWIDFGFFTLQPSELAKPMTIIAVSWSAGLPMRKLGHLGHVLPVVLLGLFPMVLVGLQPDFGSALVFLPITMAILFVSGMKKRFVIWPVVAALLLAPLVYFVLKPHQRQRIDVLLHPVAHPLALHFGKKKIEQFNLPPEIFEKMQDKRDPLQFVNNEIAYKQGKLTLNQYKNRKKGFKSLRQFYLDEGWQARQSELCVGSGGLTGKGLGGSTQVQFGFLPKSISTTDCLYAVIAEQGGFVIGGAVILLLFLIFCRCLWIAYKARDKYGRGIAAGVAMLLLCHTYINVGMAMNIAPVIGIPLPFLSYGGSFVISTMICVGLLQSVYVHRHLDDNAERLSELN